MIYNLMASIDRRGRRYLHLAPWWWVSSRAVFADVGLMIGARGGLLCSVIAWSLVTEVADTGAAGY